MVLNAKAALTVCLSCIGGMTWVLYGMDAPALDVTSPLTPADVPAEVALGQMTMDEWLPPVADNEWRAEVAQNFEQPSPVTAALDAGTEVQQLEVSPPRAAPADEMDVAMLLPSPVPAEAPEAALTLAEHAEPYEGESMQLAEDAAYAVAESASPGSGDEEQAALLEYTVRRGDSLSRIVQREFGVRDYALVELLKDLNPQVKARGGQINIGEVLVVPERDAALAWLDDTDDTGAGHFRLVSDERPEPRWYTVRQNDTLAKIAARYLDDAERWPEILKLNEKIKPHRIFPGMRIKLPPSVRMARS